MSASQRALCIAALSFAVLSGLYLLRSGSHPYGDLSNGGYADHFSHLNAARLFPRIGFDTWRRPVADLFRRLTAEERNALPADLRQATADEGPADQPKGFFVPGWPADKPLVEGWSFRPRPYPAGDMALFSPLAALYHWTPISFSRMNRLLILFLLAMAHITVWLALTEVLANRSEAPFTRLAPFLLLYPAIVYWSLEGFYDGAAIAPLVLCAIFLRRRCGVAALVAYTAAAALHFRAFYLAPWALYASWLAWHERPWSRTQRLALACGAVLAFASLVPFALVWPALQGMQRHRTFDSPAKLIALLALVSLAAAAFIRARAWLDLIVLGWIALMMVTQRFLAPWYAIFLLPWLGAPVLPLPTARPALVTAARILAAGGIMAIVFRLSFIPGSELLTSRP
jgi:hypothetical protein